MSRLAASLAFAAVAFVAAPLWAGPGGYAQAPSAQLSSEACTASQLQAVERSRASVVQVESAGMHFGALTVMWGVLYPTPRHVVVSRSALGVGRAITVTTSTGEKIGASVVTTAPDDELALLELERPVSAEAVVLADSDANLGESVIVMLPGSGTPGGGMTEVVRGAIAARSEISFRLDGGRAASGALAFDCEGRVLGVSAGWAGRGYLQANRVRALPSKPRTEDAEVGGVSAAHFSFGMLGQIAPDRGWIGLSMGGAITANDRLQLRLSGAVLGALPKRNETDRKDTVRGVRPQVEAMLGYRMLLSDSFPVYLVPAAGLTASWDFISIDRTTYESRDPGCFQQGGGPCEVQQKKETQSWKANRTRPTVGLTLLIGPLSLGYSVQTGGGEKPQHQIFFGTEF